MLIKILLCLCFISYLSAYEKPPEVEAHAWEYVQPYLLPKDHPAKKKLDRLFNSSKRPQTSIIMLHNEGFKIVTGNTRSGLGVVRHPKLKGYILKLYTDDSYMPNDWYNFATRVQGSRIIRDFIKEQGWEQEFAVPQKWIYPIPANAHPGVAGHPKQHFVLIAESVKLLPPETHEFLWKSDLMTEGKVTRLFVIISRLGLLDSVFLDNIPMDKKGKITFIDTEHFYKHPVPYHRLGHAFNPELKALWERLSK